MAMGQQTVGSTVADDTKGSCAAGRLSLVGYHAISVITGSIGHRSPSPATRRSTCRRPTIASSICATSGSCARQSRPPPAGLRYRVLLYRREEHRAVLHDGAKVRSVDITERGHVRVLLDQSYDGILSPTATVSVDACSRRPVPDDCEPLATYGRD